MIGCLTHTHYLMGRLILLRLRQLGALQAHVQNMRFINVYIEHIVCIITFVFAFAMLISANNETIICGVHNNFECA